MIDKRNTAVLASSLTAGLWLFNAIDAALFFPAKYKGRRLSVSVTPHIAYQDNGAQAKSPWILNEETISLYFLTVSRFLFGA